MNAVATEILDAVPESAQADRRARLRAAAAAAGMLRATGSSRVSAAQRARVVRSTRGLGRQVDQLLADERDRV
jgi:glycerate kinase